MNDPLSALFSFVIAVSWQSSPVILLVLIIRHLLGPRISARWSHALWTLVLVRLLIPLSCLSASFLPPFCLLPFLPFCAPHFLRQADPLCPPRNRNCATTTGRLNLIHNLPKSN